LTWRTVVVSTAAQPAPDAPMTPAPPAALRLPTPTPAPSLPPAPKPTVGGAPVALSGDPPAGRFRPEGSLGVVWDGNAALQQALGWATQLQPDNSLAAEQPFEHGRMIWVERLDSIYVIFDDGSWARFNDAFEEGMAESDPAIVAPGGKLQPMRGFGKVWREQSAVREQIGWALAPEKPDEVQLHPFERGSMLRLGGAVYALVGEVRGAWLQ